MGRYSSNPSYNHWCTPISGDPGYYWIGWTRGWRKHQRDTDEAGARRFCEKWGVRFPDKP